MGYIHDARNDEYYNEAFLDEKNSNKIKGFDYCVEQIQNLLENNLECFQEELTETLAEGKICPDDEVFSTREDLYEILYENRELISCIVTAWAELERDELITTMIEDMPQDIYEELRKKAIKENRVSHNEIKKDDRYRKIIQFKKG